MAGSERLRAECGLSLRAFLALSHLQERSYQPAELVATLGLARYETSRLLSQLESEGRVRRLRHTSDARQAEVQITPGGMRV